MNMIEKRLKKLRAKMKEKKIEAVMVSKRENYMYLSGFTGSSAHLVITGNNAFLVTDSRYVEQAASQANQFEVVQYTGNITYILNDIIGNNNIETLAFEESYITVGSYEEYGKKLEIKKFVPVGRIIEELRQIKDNEELKLIGKAVSIADDTFGHILGFIKPGIAELELAAEMEYFMKKHGATGPSFETIVASGTRSSMPHGVASGKKLDMGDTITFDFGALYNGYCSDMTRTVFLGTPDTEMKKIYGIVLEAQLKSMESVKKGLSGREIDSIARDHIANAGYGDYFGHGLGHAVGLEIHEDPRLSMTGNLIMKNKMVVTVEPGIYISGLGGVRIEDMVVVSNDNPVILTKAPKEMIVI
jgi:Xaa-Pro aminopeptidase